TFGMLRRFGADEPGGEPGGAFSRLGLAGYVALQAPEARKQLIALGRPAAEIEKMPPAQVVLLRAGAVIRSLADHHRKSFPLPSPQARAELGRGRERANKIKATEKDVFVQLFLLLVPATEKVHEAHSRLERRLAGLRAVEAVRLHAAANNGRPPKALSEITGVVVPDDPYTGKPFVYAADANTFTLEAPPTDGEQPNPANSFRYQVTIRKAG